jgi:lipopolysaccharide biosynthesis glycosyltransferase
MGTKVSMFACTLLALLKLISVACLVVHSKKIHLVGIVDESSSLSALVQLYSVVQNLNHPEQFHAHYVIFPSRYIPYGKRSNAHPGNDSQWNSSLSQLVPSKEQTFKEIFTKQLERCLPNIKTRVVSWDPPVSMQYLRNHSFEQQHIFARFYLPRIFPDLEYYIYLDNDAIVNCDLESIVHYPLIASQTVTVSSGLFATSATATASDIDKLHGRNRHKAVPKSTVSNVRPHPAVIGMVTEDHPVYQTYLSNHFNQSHPLFLRAKAHLGNSTFINAGVFIVNARLWRQNQFTERVESLLQENSESGYHVYDTAVGDQGPFYLLFHADMAPLPPEFNMRRLPKKTLLLLDKDAKGVIHFASVTHGDALYLCRFPVLHEMLSRAATPLYLATLQSFAFTHCANSTGPHELMNECSHIAHLCPNAAKLLSHSLQEQHIQPQYHSGRAPVSSWPLDEKKWGFD